MKTKKHHADMLSAIVRDTHDAVIGTDLAGKIVSWNPSASELFGYSAKDILGKSMRQIVPKYYWPDLEGVYRSIRHGRRIAHYDTRRVRADGSEIEVSITFSPIRSADGKVIGASTICRDRTREKATERARRDFAAMVSHQLRTPLGSMRWGLEVLLRDELEHLPPPTADFLRRLYRDNQRMLGLIKDLLHATRIDQGRTTNAPRAVDVPAAVRRVTRELRQFAQQQRVHVRTIARAGLPRGVVDPRRLHEVLKNFIVNAIQYSPQGASVRVSVSATASQLKISVADRGMGIAQRDLPKIFDQFYRAPAAVSSAVEGTGLGLYIAKKFVSEWGGSVSVTSKLGRGSIFVCTLPRRLPAASRRAKLSGKRVIK